MMPQHDDRQGPQRPDRVHPQGLRSPDFEYSRDPYWHSQGFKGPGPFKLKFSTTELWQLAVATAVITVIFGLSASGFNILQGVYPTVGEALVGFVIALVGVGTAFILHEMAHKIVAQRYGCWAEFRYDIKFLAGALILFLVFGFAFIAPGAVFISGRVDRRQNGIISLAGPLTNLVLAVLFIPLLFVGFISWSISGINILAYMAFYGMFINFFIGAFNMIPLGNFDGAKIWKWNPLVFVVLAVALGGPAIFLLFGI